MCIATLGLVLGVGAATAQPVDRLLHGELERINQAQTSQANVEAIVAGTRAKLAEYRTVLREIDGLVVYNSLLERQIENQQQELRTLQTSIDQVTVMQRQILPLMARMILGLERFIALDLPFLVPERMARVETLKASLESSDMTVAEQLRLIMEAWQAEIEYGTTLQAYTGVLSLDGHRREVDFLRVGRIALLYQTPDGRSSGAWSSAAREWVPLDGGLGGAIGHAIRTAREQAAEQMVLLPVPAPEGSS
jgi:hypothetical protein